MVVCEIERCIIQFTIYNAHSIAGVSSESDDRYTMLKAGERVRFKRADNDGKEHGVEVTFEDGSQVPSFRPGVSFENDCKSFCNLLHMYYMLPDERKITN